MTVLAKRRLEGDVPQGRDRIAICVAGLGDAGKPARPVDETGHRGPVRVPGIGAAEVNEPQGTEGTELRTQ